MIRDHVVAQCLKYERNFSLLDYTQPSSNRVSLQFRTLPVGCYLVTKIEVEYDGKDGSRESVCFRPGHVILSW